MEQASDNSLLYRRVALFSDHTTKLKASLGVKEYVNKIMIPLQKLRNIYSATDDEWLRILALVGRPKCYKSITKALGIS